ncbi:MAG: hypothetical protein K2L51_03500, partial [Clostridiales bacterium]|nr:hypothetical protein [Clostridiales bacterium]
DATASVEPGVSDEYCTTAAQFMTSVFNGHTINDALKPNNLIKKVRKEYERVFKTVLKILKSYSHEEMISDIVLEGSAKILEQPEYANLQKAKAMLELLDAKEELVPVLKNNDDMNLSIKIGKDNEIREGMPECAIVTASYSVNGVNIGQAGVIGPIRMDYPKVISVLDYIGKTINMLPEHAGEYPEAGEATEEERADKSDENKE